MAKVPKQPPVAGGQPLPPPPQIPKKPPVANISDENPPKPGKPPKKTKR